MPYFRRNRGNSLRPVNSLKHIVDVQGGVTANTQAATALVIAQSNPVDTEADTVTVGGKINGLFLNVQVINTTNVTLNNMYMIVYKNPGNQIIAANIPNANAVGVSDFRKFVIHQEMAMLSDANDSIPITLFKGVIKIPRHMQRMAIGDTIVVQLFTPGTGNESNFCIQSIYKEYR